MLTSPPLTFKLSKIVLEIILFQLKGNISSCFCSQDIVSAFSIFDPKKTPSMDTSEYQQYGEGSVTVLLDQYGGRKTAVSLEGEEYEKMGLVSRSQS